MKILQINKAHHHHGGANRYYLELSRILEEKGHEVACFSMKDGKNLPTVYADYFVDHLDFQNPGGLFDRVRASARIVYSTQARQRIGKLIDRFRPEIAHFHNIYHHISPSVLLELEKKGIPVVMTAHDYKLICPNYTLFNGVDICEKCRGGKSYQVLLTSCHGGSVFSGLILATEAYLHRMLGSYEKGLDLIITPSEFMKKILIEFGIPAEKIQFVPNFVDPIPEDLGPDTGDYVLYFGRLSLEKGLATLIRAMSRLPDLSLVLAGDGPQRSELEYLSGKEQVSNVRFVGQKDHVEIEGLIRGCLFTVLPSIWYENCPLSILESMAFGKPVIGSRIGGIPDLIDDGKDGLLFPAGDEEKLSEKIRLLADDSNLLRLFGGNGYKKVKEKYNREVHYRSVLSVYNTLLGK